MASSIEGTGTSGQRRRRRPLAAVTLAPTDIVILRRARKPTNRVRQPGPWLPLAIVDDAALAAAIVDVFDRTAPDQEARALPHSAFVREVRTEDRERILDGLRNPTLAEKRLLAALREQARSRLHAGARRERAAQPAASGRRGFVDRGGREYAGVGVALASARPPAAASTADGG